ncbi:peptidase U32 family protein [Anaerotardibacter muris]|uniref:peptidase U32 family protein n=1 Tax=Anaerotardibacter muris TaxID=2941505 RepID=UPI00203BAE3B|nr:U32 family peptidase [Anaerotardibacter muris]
MTSENTHTKLPELLAPAGGFEQLRYALYFGADAVYLACDKFGLRQRAQNFALEDMARAVQIAHEAGAKVYVTLNAYLHDADLTDLPAYLKSLEAAGVDAFIVSDLGVLAEARKHAPSVDIHVSTQASVSNVAAARMWQQLGAKRIVTAREMSLEEISQLKRELPDMELEVFVQGAMCMAISGRCLISDFLAGRSANQGHCVQPCRWSYRLEEETRPGEYFPVEQDESGTYLMNSKDLNMLAHVDDLIAAGVDSIKIEGRVKKAFYVATVVNAYRHVLDGESPAQWAEELNCISHRPYSTGFFYGNVEQSFSDDIYTQLYDWVAEVAASTPTDWMPDSADTPAIARSLGAEAKDGRRDLMRDEEIASEQAIHNAGCSQFYRTIVYCRNRFYEGDVLELLSPHKEVTKIPVLGLHELFFSDAQDRDLPKNYTAPASDRAKEGDGFTLGEEINAVPVDVANKAMGVYAFYTSVPLERYDILRAKRHDPSRKN